MLEFFHCYCGIIRKNSIFVASNLTETQSLGGSREEKGSLTYHTFNLEKDGSFSYSHKGDYEPEYYSGTWKVNNLGFITFNVTKASPYTGE